jgi:hypothetical protein
MAHHIAEWLGIPTGVVIAAMMILRKQGMALRARRQQARAANQAAGNQAEANQPVAHQAAAGSRPGGP